MVFNRKCTGNQLLSGDKVTLKSNWWLRMICALPKRNRVLREKKKICKERKRMRLIYYYYYFGFVLFNVIELESKVILLYWENNSKRLDFLVAIIFHYILIFIIQIFGSWRIGKFCWQFERIIKNPGWQKKAIKVLTWLRNQLALIFIFFSIYDYLRGLVCWRKS